MDDLQSRLKIGGFWTGERLLKLLIFVMLVMLVVLSFTLQQQVAIQATQHEMEEEQERAEERSYVNRALNCAIIVAVGAQLPSECLWVDVAGYYDPGADPVVGANSEGQKLNRRLLCQILATVEGHAPECQ